MYRRQGKYEAAETLEDCAIRSKKDALELVQQTRVGSAEKRRSRNIPSYSSESGQNESGDTVYIQNVIDSSCH